MDDRQSRRDQLKARFRADQRVRGLFESLSLEMQSIVSAHSAVGEDGVRRMDASQLVRAEEDVAKALNRIYGPRKGQPSALETAVTDSTSETRRSVVANAVGFIESKVPEDLWAKMNEPTRE